MLYIKSRVKIFIHNKFLYKEICLLASFISKLLIEMKLLILFCLFKPRLRLFYQHLFINNLPKKLLYIINFF